MDGAFDVYFTLEACILFTHGHINVCALATSAVHNSEPSKLFSAHVPQQPFKPVAVGTQTCVFFVKRKQLVSRLPDRLALHWRFRAVAFSGQKSRVPLCNAHFVLRFNRASNPAFESDAPQASRRSTLR